MKRLIPAALALLIFLSGCAGGAPNAAERARDDYMPYIETALKVVEDSPRDDLSLVTYPFDEADAYAGPTAEQEEKYGGGRSYVENDREYFDAVCDLVAENLPREASAYDQYRYIAVFVSLCMEYDYKGKAGLSSITPYGAVTGGRAICLGYTNSFLYLCERAGLWCQAVGGKATWNGEEHGWNLVKLEDGTYHVDVTWCDQTGTPGSEGWGSYFMLTEDAILRDHKIDDWSGSHATGKTIY